MNNPQKIAASRQFARCLGILAAGLLGVASPLAADIGIDFNSFAHQGEQAEMQGPDEHCGVGNVWNQVTIPQENGGVLAAEALLDSAGAPTPVSIELKEPSIKSWWAARGALPDSKLLRDYVNLPKPASIRIAGLAPNTPHHIAAFGYPLDWGKVDLTLNGANLKIASGTKAGAERQPVGILTATTDASGTLQGTVSGMLAGLYLGTSPIVVKSTEVAVTEREPEKEKPPVFPPSNSVVYKTVEGIDFAIDIYNPEGHTASDRRPAILFFHGGSWSGGWKTMFASQCHYLAQRGMVAMTVAYRVTSRPPKSEPADCVRDAKSALRWVRKHALELGIDSERILAGGGSAGGHLAAATAYLDDYNEEGEDTSVSCRPAALVLFNPVSDNGPGNGYHFGPQPIAETWRSWSPKHNITKEKAVPTIYFLGDQDHLISVATGEAYKKATEEAGAECEFHVYENAKHSFFHGGPALNDTLEKTEHFLTRLGFLPASEPKNTP